MYSRAPFTVFFVLLSLLAVAVCIGLRVPETTPRSARQGVLDLRNDDLDRQSAVEIGGEWDFFWQRQLEPKDFSIESTPASDGVLTLPGTWNGYKIGEQTLGGNGFATLRLTILTAPAQSLQAIRIAGVYSAYRLWANGRLIAESGRVGQTLKDEVMDHSLRLVPLRADGESIDLVFQVSCFHMDKTSLPSLQLGRLTDLSAAQSRIWGLALFCAGTLLLMGIYHIALYALYRTNRSPLYFGMYCLVWTVFIVSNHTSDWAIRVFLPELAGEQLYRSSVAYYALAAPLSYHFFRSLFPQEFPRGLLFVFWGMGSVYAAIALALSTQLSSAMLPLFHLVVAAKSCFFLWALSQATRRRREGASIIFVGFIVLCALSFNDIFSAMNLIRSYRLAYVGMLFLMLTQSLALAKRFTRLFLEVEELSTGLLERNEALEQEIAERTRLQQEVVSISEEERRRISHELHDGLCQQLTGARLQSAALEGEWPDEAARAIGQARLSKLLVESVDHAYQLSRGLWSMGPDSDNLCHALTTLAQSQSESSGISIVTDLHPACPACTTSNGVQMFCIAREAIVNSIKHGNPKQIFVSLSCNGSRKATLCISDDGVGWRSDKNSKGGLGLRIMAYRAQMVGGEFRIEDREGGGTNVTCSIPCSALPPPSGLKTDFGSQ